MEHMPAYWRTCAHTEASGCVLAAPTSGEGADAPGNAAFVLSDLCTPHQYEQAGLQAVCSAASCQCTLLGTVPQVKD